MNLVELSREKGFRGRDNLHAVNEGYYPLWMSELSQWFRQEHNLYVEAPPNASGYYWVIEKTNGTSVANSEFKGPNEGGVWDQYEEALEAALFEALKLIP